MVPRRSADREGTAACTPSSGPFPFSGSRSDLTRMVFLAAGIHGLSARSRKTVGQAGMSRAIGHATRRRVAAEGEVDRARAVDGPATLARREVEQRARLRADDIASNALRCEQ